MFKLFKRFNFYSIRSKLTVCFLILSVLPISLFALFSYNYYLKSLYNNVAVYTYEVIERVDKNIETYISDIDNILNLREDYYILQYLKLREVGDIDGNRKYTVRIWEYFDRLKKMKTDLEDIRLIDYSGDTISCNGIYWTNKKNDFLYNDLKLKKTDDISIQPPYVNNFDKNVFTIAKAVNSPTLHGMGLLCIDINVNFLNKICSDIKLGEKGYIYLMDRSGRIIYLPENSNQSRYSGAVIKNSRLLDSESGNFTHHMDGTNYIVTFKTSVKTGWKIVGVTPEAEMTKDINKINQISLAVIAGCVIVAIFLTIYLTTILTNPIRKLRSLMRQAAENDLSINATIGTRDEIGQLAQSFNKMINKIRELMDKILEDQLKIRKMEMKAMQELIKPHFVYNTLDSIIGLLEQNRNEDAMNLVESLGKFFRTSLSHGKEVIQIREEMDHVRCYLLIQQFRFSNKFDYLFELEDDIYRYKTIKLILQPLVENAIYHGIRGLTDKKGLIVIKAYTREGQIYFEIIDNGQGMQEETVAYINGRVLTGEEAALDENLYFGIRNVNERLRLNFGKEFGLRYESKVTVGTKAVVNIPMVD